ncbi:hypothetical protein SRHO_G00016060 [Serrasalmus rhombeus]
MLPGYWLTLLSIKCRPVVTNRVSPSEGSQAVLKENLTALESEVAVLESEQNRLSQEQAVNEAQIFALQMNLTTEEHQLDSCMALGDAARSQQVAAESQRKACESRSRYLNRHLASCDVQD